MNEKMECKLFLFSMIVLFVACKDSNKTDNNSSEQFVTEQAKPKSDLLVQWQYPNDMDPLTAMDIRHKLENKIDSVLQQKYLGEWIFGDMGPGGANMGYRVTSKPDETIKTILEVLHKEGLQTNCVIATDVDFVSGKWVYTILYPKDYKGDFNPL